MTARSAPSAPQNKAAGGVQRLRIADLAPADRAALDAALASPQRFRSREQDLTGVLVLLLGGLLTGAGVAIAGTDWRVVADIVRAGQFPLLQYNMGAIGLVAAVAAIGGVAAFWRHVHGRWGYALLPDAIVRVHGNRLVLVRVDDIRDVRDRSGRFSSNPFGIGRRWLSRSFRSLEITCWDGTRASFNEVGLYQDLLASRTTPSAPEPENSPMKAPRTTWEYKRNGWTCYLEVGPTSITAGRNRGTIATDAAGGVSTQRFLDGEWNDRIRKEFGEAVLREALESARILMELAGSAARDKSGGQHPAPGIARTSTGDNQ